MFLSLDRALGVTNWITVIGLDFVTPKSDLDVEQTGISLLYINWSKLQICSDSILDYHWHKNINILSDT